MFFTQLRTGLHGRTFTLYRFGSMYKDAEARRAALASRNEMSGPVFKIKDDPRPPIPDEVKKYERWQRRRLSMKPGITCLWQVSGRNGIDFEDWMRLDLAYIDTWSLRLDVQILLRTVPVVLTARGAH